MEDAERRAKMTHSSLATASASGIVGMAGNPVTSSLGSVSNMNEMARSLLCPVDEEVTVKFALPNPVLGHVIGKGGANVKEYLATGVNVKILQDERSHSRSYDEKPVLLTGPLELVLAVEKAILDRWANAPAKVLAQIQLIPPDGGQQQDAPQHGGYGGHGHGYGHAPHAAPPGASAAPHRESVATSFGISSRADAFWPRAPRPGRPAPPRMARKKKKRDELLLFSRRRGKKRECGARP